VSDLPVVNKDIWRDEQREAGGINRETGGMSRERLEG
jgi:hypothetical protein